MSDERNGNSTLISVMSILGILVVAIVGGLILFQKNRNPDAPVIAAFSAGEDERVDDAFDPITWAREDAAMPPLEEADGGEPGEVDYEGGMGAGSAAEDGEGAGTEPVPATPRVSTQTDEPAPTPSTRPAAAPQRQPAAVETVREVTENAFWVQVFSTGSVGKAEEVRDSMVAKGLPALVQTRLVDGQTWYRVRIGAFSVEAEAERYADIVRGISGFEASYVVQAPVTRRIES